MFEFQLGRINDNISEIAGSVNYFSAAEFDGVAEYDPSYVSAVNMAFDLAEAACASTIEALKAPVETISKQQLETYDAHLAHVCRNVGVEYNAVDLGNLSYDDGEIGNLASDIVAKVKAAIKKLIDAAKAAWKAVKKRVKDFWNKHFGNLGRMGKKAAELKDTAKALELKEKAGSQEGTKLGEVDITSVYDLLQVDGKVAVDQRFFETLKTVKDMPNTKATIGATLKLISSNGPEESKALLEEFKDVIGPVALGVVKDFGGVATWDRTGGDKISSESNPFPGGWSIIVSDDTGIEVNASLVESSKTKLAKSDAMIPALSNSDIVSLCDGIHDGLKGLESFKSGADEVSELIDKQAEGLNKVADKEFASAEEISATLALIRKQNTGITTANTLYADRAGKILMAYYKLAVMSLQANEKANKE